MAGDDRGWVLHRYLASHSLALIAEWGAVIGLLVYAYEQEGADIVGLASFTSLTPYVFVAAFTARAVQRWAPAAVRVAAIAGQALGFGAAAIVILVEGSVWLAVAGTTIGFAAATTLRPANAVLLPALVRTSRQLTAANVRLGYGDSTALLIGPLTATVLLGLGGPAATLVGCAMLSLAAAVIAVIDVGIGPPAPLPGPSTEHDRRRVVAVFAMPFGDVARVLRRRGARGVLLVVVAQYGLVGASDVMWVVIAAERIDLGDAGAGVLSALFGAGSCLCALFLGRAARRLTLAPLMLISLAVIAAACFGLAASITVAVAVVLVPIMGLNRGLLDLLGRVLLQRSAPPSELANVFGAVETAAGVGLLSGSLLAQAMIRAFSPAGALIGIGMVSAATIVVVFDWLRAADAEADVPVVEMSLLAQHPVFAPLPVMSLEAVARHARELHVADGAQVITEGEPGDCYYAVVEGRFDVTAGDRNLGSVERGDGFGEIALLADVPRTATVRAVGPGSLLAIDREPFLLAVTGHAPAHDAAWTRVHGLDGAPRRSDRTMSSGGRETRAMAEYTASVLVEGRYFGEGPRWHEGRFWFSDFYAHEVCSVGLEGDVRVEVELDGEQPSGLGWLPDGRLLVVGMTRRQVLRHEHDGSLVVHADLNEIATFHANDMLVDASGNAYVGNFGFDLDTTLEHLGVEGLLGSLMADPSPYVADLAIVSPDGTASVAAPRLTFPNGMVLLDGGATLVVAQTLGFELTAFTRAADGTLSDQRTWASLASLMVAPDGIAADPAGAIWVANALAPAVIRVEREGTVTDTVQTSQNAYACAIGGPAGRHLLICTAAGSAAAVAGAARTGKLELVELPA